MSLTSKLTVIGAAGGQSGPEYWASRIDKVANDEIRFADVCCDSSDNIIAVGYRDYSSSKGFVIKYDKFGAVQWQQEYTGTTTTRFSSVDTDSNNNVYIVGADNSLGNTAYLIKYDASGNFQWIRSYDNNQFYVFNRIGIDDNDNIIVMGNNASSRILWAKYDSSGTLLNSKNLYVSTYSESMRDGDIVKTTGDWIFSGNTSQNGANTDGTFAKITSGGGLSFRKRFSGSNTQIFYNAGATRDGSALYGFFYNFAASATTSRRILKLNSTGTVVTSRTVDNNYTGYMAIDSNNRVLITSSVGFISCDEFLNAGSTFSRNFSGFNPFGITTDSENNIILVGTTGNSTFRNDEAGIVKLPSDGTGTGTWDWLTYSTDTSTITGAATSSSTNGGGSLQTVTGTFGSYDPFTKTDPAYTTELYEIEP